MKVGCWRRNLQWKGWVYVDLSILRVLGFLEGAYMQDLFFGNALGDASAHTKPAYLHASLSSLSRMKLTDMVSIRNVSTSSGTDLKELHVIMWLRGLPLRMHRWAVGGPSPLFWPNFTACMRSGIVWTWERDASIFWQGDHRGRKEIFKLAASGHKTVQKQF